MSITRSFLSFFVVLALALLAGILSTTPALASKQAVDFFGGTGTLGGQFTQTAEYGIAVNYTGAGGVPAGTVYVTDGGLFDTAGDRGNRVQRFQREDSGTPADITDDTYSFVSAWGAGVDGGGTDYEICTVAADCVRGAPIGGNGTLAGNGALNKPSGIAVDQDTGEVYVVDSSSRRTLDNNFRINVYSATGAFLRSFGWDVVESGPGDNGTGYEICKAGVDICKTGLPGSGLGQIGAFFDGPGGGFDGERAAEGIAVSQPDGNPATGTVFLADQFNRRVNTYNLDGSSPSSIGSAATFEPVQPNALAVDSRGILYASNTKNKNQIERYDTQNANGSGVGFLTPIASPPLLAGFFTDGLTVDPDSDGPGADIDVLYVLRGGYPAQGGEIQQFGPLNPPGLTAPPIAVDDTHGTVFPYQRARGLAAEPPTDRLYVSATYSGQGDGVFVLDDEGPPPTATLDSITGITARSATVHATINPNGPPNTSYRFEYSTDQVKWTSAGEVVLGHQEDPQAVEETIGLGAGLHPNTHYYVRLIAGRKFGTPIITAPLDFTTASSPPIVETTGSPVRSSTTAQLNGRVVPSNAATEYHFEYGAQGPCSVPTNSCTSTEPHAAGSGDEMELVTEQVEGLEPDTTYHYRVVAENGDPAGPAFGADMTVRTRASGAPLSHGDFPGPPGSDRAYEQVSPPDTGGTPVVYAFAVSDDGTRAFYRVAGGTPLSKTGTTLTMLYAERTPSGWRSEDSSPPRDQLVGGLWLDPAGLPDLSNQIALNVNSTDARMALWRMQPGQPAIEVFTAPGVPINPAIVSEDASRVLVSIKGSHDPSHPSPPSFNQLYDVSSGTPQLVSLLPGDSVSGCEVLSGTGGVQAEFAPSAKRWVSPNGSLAFFETCGALYMRDLVTDQTKLIGGGSFAKWTPAGVFLNSGQSLAPGDTGGSDVYRYDIDDESLECVTCVIPGLSANVVSNAIAPDGSRVYFRSSTALLPGAPTLGIYRVEVASGDFAYVAPINPADSVLEGSDTGNAITPDGSTFVFASSNPGLNALGGQQNGGTLQFYRYDDRERSLVCLSCPQDGSVPQEAITRSMVSFSILVGANRTALSADGQTFAFSTDNALLPADQNTARLGQNASVGADVYEWRDGRLLLVTDGLREWPDDGPQVSAITPSGNDIFFTAATQYTPDALDGYSRLYTARIGGGLEYPVPPKPCPLEVCQGTPRGAPEEQAPGSGSFSGPGNVVGGFAPRRPCPKGRHKARRGGKTRCVKSGGKKQRQHQRAKHDRRAQR